MLTVNTPAQNPEAAEPIEYAAYGSRVKAAVTDSFLLGIASVLLYFGLVVFVVRGGPCHDTPPAAVLAGPPALGPAGGPCPAAGPAVGAARARRGVGRGRRLSAVAVGGRAGGPAARPGPRPHR